MQIYIKDVSGYDNAPIMLAKPKVKDDLLLSCKIAFSEFNSEIDNDYCLYSVWECETIDEIQEVLEENEFIFELRE